MNTPENYTLDDVRNNFLLPVIDIIVQNKFQYPEELSYLTGSIMQDLRNVQMQTGHILNDFEETWKEIDKYLLRVKQTIKNLESFKY